MQTKISCRRRFGNAMRLLERLVLAVFFAGFCTYGINLKCGEQKCKCCTRTKKSDFKITGKDFGDLKTKRTNLDLHCLKYSWTIVSPRNNKKIRLNIRRFLLLKGDSVKIYDGERKSASLITEYTTGHVPREIVSSGSRMLVTLKTTCEKRTRHFFASFKTIDCGGLVTLENDKKVVLSPEMKFGDYLPNSDCLWIVVPRQFKASKVANIRWKIKSFTTEENRDVLRIYSSLDATNINVETLTGEVLPSTSRSYDKTPGLLFHFTSDKNVQKKAFKITIEQLLDDELCREEVIQNGGIYMSNFSQRMDYWCCPGYKRKGPPFKICNATTWVPEIPVYCERTEYCVKPLPPLHGKIVEDYNTKFSVGRTITLKCDNGYYQEKERGIDTVTATCTCNGEWTYKPSVPNCKPITCGELPNAPEGGSRTISKKNLGSGYLQTTVANYSCSTGFGFRGIPFRFCDSNGEWNAHSKLPNIPHECVKDLSVCPDPGVLGNGSRRVRSFEDGEIVSYACDPSYKLVGSTYRTCRASGLPENEVPYWTGSHPFCKSLLQDPRKVAAKLRVNFIDRVIGCEEDTRDGNETTETAGSNETQCKGRSIVVGQGCVNIAFALDCSKSMQPQFSKSVEFVKTVVNVFANVDDGAADFSLITYDNKPKERFNFGELPNTTAVIDKINAIDFDKSCWGATDTSKVLQYMQDNIFNSVQDTNCTRAAFLVTDGQTNWGGDPETAAKNLLETGTTLYVVAIYDLKEREEFDPGSFRKLVNEESHVMHVGDISEVIKIVFDIKIDYAECGLVDASTCEDLRRGRTVGGCRTKDGDWPWVVGIYISDDDGTRIQCGGAIIDRCTILTAAHCITTETQNLLVVVGDRQRLVKERTEMTFTVCRTSVHTGFGNSGTPTFDDDIALLHLCCCIPKYGPYVRPVCLPQSGDENLYREGVQGTVVGWGETRRRILGQETQFTVDLQQVELPVTNSGLCKATDPDEITENMFCAGDGNGDKDACNGDSGGPFVSQRLYDCGIKEERYVVTGIVSWGDGCAQRGKYGLYTNVSRYLSWIKDEQEAYIGSENFEDAACKPKQIIT